MPGKRFCLYSDKAIQIKLSEIENIKTEIRIKLGYNGIPPQSTVDQTKILTSFGNKIKLTLIYKKKSYTLKKINKGIKKKIYKGLCYYQSSMNNNV